MTMKRLSMRRIKEVLRLSFEGGCYLEDFDISYHFLYA